ncbi:MAG: ribonuclease HII [Patescibacteria group bacterium]
MPSIQFLIGIDEVGRGPIAGPVAVGAFMFLNEKAKRIFRDVKESKQLTDKKREEWFRKIRIQKSKCKVDYAVCFSSSRAINKRGITKAIKSSLNRSLKKLEVGKSTFYNSKILLDGGLKAPANYKNQKTIIRGDEKEMAIALASICAKVTRDRYMRRLSKKYPRYGFEIHKGYGTKKHYEAIRKYGVCREHRLTFL